MKTYAVSLLILILSNHTFSHEAAPESVEVQGKKINLVGDAISASEGVVGQTEISIRPILRTGELLELVPGMVVTQHSGSGKANQYFLRGFNLDHGTDFATFVDGMPINMVSHGHGQGYTDINFLIPEAVSMLTYKKGAYFSDVGDFSGAGSVSIATASELDRDLLSVTLGEYNYQRVLALGDRAMFGGNTLVAAEVQRYDGPWSDIDEDIKKTNMLVKHSSALANGDFDVSLMIYDNSWNSADQIPNRAVEQGIIDEFGSIDNSVGGTSSRNSVNTSWKKDGWSLSGYIIDYELNLWSNFTYFLEDETNGDQFEQVDERKIYGGQIEYSFESSIASRAMKNRFGLQARFDDIAEVGLYHTQNRNRLGVTRSDAIDQTSLGLFWENTIVWDHHLRTVFGARYDAIDYSVNSLVANNRFDVDLSDNGGSASGDLSSLKASLIYSFNDSWEAYISAGQGFHSNDARGAVISIDPSSGESVEQVDPLVQSEGYEVGLRGFISDRLNASIGLWSLDLDSELLFVGDAGNTEASLPSTRKGVEMALTYYFFDNFSADLEYAATDAEFKNVSEADGNLIPGAIEDVLQAGLNLGSDQDGWSGSLRLRHFGERPLLEDGSVKSEESTIWNLRANYTHKNWRLSADLLNLTDSRDHDIDYYYESRLQNETAAVEDIHYHVIEPRSVRASVAYSF